MPTGSRDRLRLAITLGDVRGIGPEIVSKALTHEDVRAAADFVIVGPRDAGIAVDEAVGAWSRRGDAGEAGRYAGLAIERAVQLAQAGAVQGIVTAPLDKAALHAGGFDYPGHTEMLAALTRSRVAMMLASDRLRVVLATTHLPLRNVLRALTRDAIIDAATVTRRGLQEWFGIERPRIALCAVNPHAGDNGRFGREDDELLRPAAAAAGIEGPFPADTVFVRAMRGAFDAVIAPYHDVGMTAIKVASFGSAVNVTLGLPFVRTSVDHGTGFDIVTLGVADGSSLVEAMKTAVALVESGHRPPTPSPHA